MKNDYFIKWALGKVLDKMEKLAAKTPNKTDDKIVAALKKAYDLYMKSIES